MYVNTRSDVSVFVPLGRREDIGMIELPEQWLADIEAQLSKALETLDAHSEPLIAAHVAAALECVQSRLRRGEPSSD